MSLEALYPQFSLSLLRLPALQNLPCTDCSCRVQRVWIFKVIPVLVHHLSIRCHEIVEPQEHVSHVMRTCASGSIQLPRHAINLAAIALPSIPVTKSLMTKSTIGHCTLPQSISELWAHILLQFLHRLAPPAPPSTLYAPPHRPGTMASIRANARKVVCIGRNYA